MTKKSISVEGACSHGATLKALDDDHTNSKQQFFLGQHGSIFSVHCPGLVIAKSDTGTITLQTFRLNQNKMKWKFDAVNTISSVADPTQILALDDNTDTLVLKSKSGSSTDAVWKRLNTRLLERSSDWKQKWTVSFVDDAYSGDATTLENLILDHTDTVCYGVNDAFSPSFEEFAKGLSIADASNQEECGETREQLGFDKDYSFDVDVKDKFHEHQVSRSQLIWFVFTVLGIILTTMFCFVVRPILYRC